MPLSDSYNGPPTVPKVASEGQGMPSWQGPPPHVPHGALKTEQEQVAWTGHNLPGPGTAAQQNKLI